MRKVGRYGEDWSGGEEAVVEIGAFKEEMSQGVEGMPDEEDAVFRRSGVGEEAGGKAVGGE